MSKPFNPKDHYFHKAKEEGYLARSAFKLKEIQQKFKVLKKGNFVLDLGCAPGSWSQVVMELNQNTGFLLGVDLASVNLSGSNAKFLQHDIFTLEDEKFEGAPYDCILSDMAPKTTGIAFTDQARSEELCLKVLELSNKFLKKGGNVVMKLFEGGGAPQIAKEIKNRFEKLERLKPDSTRSISKEIFLVGLKKK